MLELKDLTVSYDICILDHVNYIFPDTGLVGIKGPSGCGKSTLLYCLCGLLQYNGTITFNHEVIDKKFSKMIGFIKQNNDLKRISWLDVILDRLILIRKRWIRLLDA